MVGDTHHYRARTWVGPRHESDRWEPAPLGDLRCPTVRSCGTVRDVEAIYKAQIASMVWRDVRSEWHPVRMGEPATFGSCRSRLAHANRSPVRSHEGGVYQRAEPAVKGSFTGIESLSPAI